MKWFLVLPLSLLVACGDDISSNRKMGQNTQILQGVEGVTEAEQFLRSHIARSKGSTILSYKEEIANVASGTLPEESYHSVPLIGSDTELTTSTVEAFGRPATTCGFGTSFQSIKARINDCAKLNGNLSTWNATSSGIGGESTWHLVQRTDNGTEYWIDSRTNMIWSDFQRQSDGSKLFNWCQASGNTESGSGAIDCKAIGNIESTCFGTTNSDLGEQVKWRLPTRNDFLQADINGLRAVLKTETSGAIWTATLRASAIGKDEAWVYSSKEGTLSAAKLNDLNLVRCMGAPVSI